MNRHNLSHYARCKIRRSTDHIRDLIAFSSPLHSSLYKIECTSNKDEASPTGKCYQLVYTPDDYMRERFSLIIGDALNNMRSSLDYLSTSIVNSRIDGDRKKITFPMDKERKNLNKRTLDAMDFALPGSSNLILENLRPENGENEIYWKFNSLRNLDQHNLILPTITIVDISNINGTTNSGNFSGMVYRNDASKRFTLFETDQPISVSGDFSINADLRFGTDTPHFQGMDVLVTLANIQKLALSTIIAFEKLLESSQSSA